MSMNQTPPISPVVKLKLKELDDKKLLLDNNALNHASTKLQTLLNTELESSSHGDTNDGDKDSTTIQEKVSISAGDESMPVSDRLSSLISQLIPLYGENNNSNKQSTVILTSDSISELISILNQTVTVLQNQESLLNFFKLNSDIVQEQSSIEKELLIREIEIMRGIQSRQAKVLDRNRRNSEPVKAQITRRRVLKAGLRTRSNLAELPLSLSHETAIESDRTISDDDDSTAVKQDASVQRNSSIVELNKKMRDEEYENLIGDISKNQKLFLHNKFGYYYNTLNDERQSRRKRRSIHSSGVAKK